MSGAIDKYVYMLTHTVFQRRYRMKYAKTEEVDDPHEIRHPILRETLLRHWRGEPLEIASVADVPAGTGMGSSGSFTVCLMKGLAQARRTSITPAALAESACEIEIDVLGEPVGKQDPTSPPTAASARTPSPGTAASRWSPWSSTPPRCAGWEIICCCSSRATHARPAPVLADQDRRSRERDRDMLENLHVTKELGHQSRELLVSGDLEAYGELMHEHWQNKRRRSSGMANERVDELYTLARRSGAIGGKLVGARGWRLPARLRAAAR